MHINKTFIGNCLIVMTVVDIITETAALLVTVILKRVENCSWKMVTETKIS